MKEETENLDKMSKILDIGLEEKRKKDFEEQKPFVIVHGKDEKEYEIPIKVRISSLLLDKVLPLIRKYKASIFLEFRDKQLIPAGLISPEKFRAKKVNKDLTDEEQNNLYLMELLRFAREIFKDEKFCKTAIYSEDDFEVKIKGSKLATDRPQARETKRLNIEIIKLIIDAHKLNTDAEYKDLKLLNIIPELMSNYDSEFWINQDENEVARIADRFRKERL